MEARQEVEAGQLLATLDEVIGAQNLIVRPDPSTFEEIVQEPGDLFYFPGGTWHSTDTIGDDEGPFEPGPVPMF